MDALRLSLLALVVSVAACNGSSSDDDDGATTAPAPTPTVTPLFETHILPIIAASCGAGDNACHSRVAYGANSANGCRGWLTLEDTMLGAEFYSGAQNGNPTGCVDRDLYYRLTQITSWECGPPAGAGVEMAYVVPGDTANSYLYRKINGGPYCSDGGPSDPMPLNAPLPAAQIDLIRRWIEAGAPRVP